MQTIEPKSSSHQTFRLQNVDEPNIICLVVLSAFASMGAVIMTPSLPAMVHFFHIASGMGQLAVTCFLLGYAIGQLIYGPIANRLGRKPAFYIGIAVATLGSLFSILASPAHSFGLFLCGRCLEALGSSVGLVVCFTIINDFYFPKQSRKIVGMLMLAFAIIPGIALVVGGFLTQYIDWQASFYFLLIYGISLFFVAYHLPETVLRLDRHALESRYLFKHYLQMYMNPALVAYSLLYGLTAACVYIYSLEGPFIAIGFLHISPSIYGLLGLSPYLGAVFGSYITVHYSDVMSAQKMLWLGLGFEMLATLIMLLSFIAGFINMWTLLSPMLLFMIGHALLLGNASSLALASTDDKANGSAVLNFTGVGIAVICTFCTGFIHRGSFHSLLPTALVLIVCCMILTSFIWVRRLPRVNI